MKKLDASLSNKIRVYDDFIDDLEMIEMLKVESKIAKTISGENHYDLTEAQKYIYNLSKLAVMDYCFEENIDFNELEFNNFQKGMLKKYDESMVTNHLYEPHHDIAEGGYVTAIYYIDSSYSPDKWVGGELAVYEKLSFVDYPGNTINILPKPNRLVIFPGFYVHRVKPYFGDKPRTSIVLGWGAVESVKSKCVII